MAWNPSPKVAVARDIAEKFGKSKVVILMLNEKDYTMESVSYGETKQKCAEAKKLADVIYNAAYKFLASQ
jgi:hypothetical protein